MPPKTKTPAPIDRPLSRAYLRQFTGWSTAYPPGVSEPTSLRLMENMMVNRDGSLRIRPGLKYFNYTVLPDGDNIGEAATEQMVGTHETFFTEQGKAYLYAVREDDGTVGFRVYADDGTGTFLIQTLLEALFDVPQGIENLSFTEATTYVKYVQIDNKIFALSNAGESMRMFSVGNEKSAQRLFSIERPNWDTDDKLTVVQPEAAWINTGVPVGTRINRIVNPTFELSLDHWEENNDVSRMVRSDDFGHSGDYSMKLSSKALRTNLVTQPLHDVASTGLDDWYFDYNCFNIAIDAGYMKIVLNDNDLNGWASSDNFACDPKTKYRMGMTIGNAVGMDHGYVEVLYWDSSNHYISKERIDDFIGLNTPGRKETDAFTTPAGCKSFSIRLAGVRDNLAGAATWQVKDIFVGLNSEGSTTAVDGDKGTDYYWTGTINDSTSVYHPPQNVVVHSSVISATALDYYASLYARAGSTPRNAFLQLRAESGLGNALAYTDGADTATGSGTWARVEEGATLPTNTASVRLFITVKAVARNEYHYIDSVLLERASALDDYFSGSTPNIPNFTYEWEGEKHNSRSFENEFTGGDTNPSSETKTADTLVSNDSDLNDVSFGFFYTFATEIGESAASQSTIVRVQRPWSSWRWETPNGAGEPSGTETKVPELCADQLVAYMPEDVFNEAIAAGAIAWSLYMYTWSNQDPFPVSAVLLQRKEMNADSVYGTDSWGRATPSQAEISTDGAVIPTKSSRLNSSYPSHGGQGLVAADRMIMVFDPNEAAVIRWSSNQQGSYHDFSASKGGGFKTLTSGNLFIPACVKLWQNPQSADTLTILTMGVDGHSTGYYMQPAQVASQSEAVNIMGFEETTATPGTVSPYGCEVLNNSLYHPLDDQLMKSTASNYNINHLSVTDKILNLWQALSSKDHIVSSQLDNRLYYLVANPNGLQLEENCWGNEVWVFDAAAKTGTWSRWTVQGHSLRKIERNGKIVMSLVHPTGLFYFDTEATTDDYVDDAGLVQTRNIPWLLETNTQGANRAHDAWAHLQQANLVVGFFQGQMKYGVRGIDVNGKAIDINKVIRDNNPPGVEAFDLEDFLLIRRVMKEWFFYAESITVDDVVQHSAGQVSLVQYRYAPSTVNTGYEFGSVETFEYGRAGNDADDRNTLNGVPMPYIDAGRP